MTDQEACERLIHLQANAILLLVEMLQTRVDDLSEDEQRYLSFMKSGSYHALGEGDAS